MWQPFFVPAGGTRSRPRTASLPRVGVAKRCTMASGHAELGPARTSTWKTQLGLEQAWLTLRSLCLLTGRAVLTMCATSGCPTKGRVGAAWAQRVLQVILALSVTTHTSATRQWRPEAAEGAAGDGVWRGGCNCLIATEPLASLAEMRRVVLEHNACAMPGVSLKFETFIPVMWRAVAQGYVRHEHATFIYEGLRYGFKAGFDSSKLVGHRWFKNYPSATAASGLDAVLTAARVSDVIPPPRVSLVRDSSDWGKGTN